MLVVLDVEVEVVTVDVVLVGGPVVVERDGQAHVEVVLLLVDVFVVVVDVVVVVLVVLVVGIVVVVLVLVVVVFVTVVSVVDVVVVCQSQHHS